MFQKTREKQEADKDSGRAFFFFVVVVAKMVFTKDKLEGEKNSVDGKV